MAQSPVLHPNVLYESSAVLVVDKPAGLLSQGDKSGDKSLVDWARTRHGKNWVGLIHRLDRNTSGVLVLAKTEAAARELTAQLQDGRLSRTYAGWVRGAISEPRTLEDLLWKDTEKNLVRVVAPQSPRAKDAQMARMTLTPLRQASWMGTPVTLMEFKLETGRSHQIRVQAQNAGLPLLGDPKYGGIVEFEPAFGRPALHSWRVAFQDPSSKENVQVEAPLPSDFSF